MSVDVGKENDVTTAADTRGKSSDGTREWGTRTAGWRRGLIRSAPRFSRDLMGDRSPSCSSRLRLLSRLVSVVAALFVLSVTGARRRQPTWQCPCAASTTKALRHRPSSAARSTAAVSARRRATRPAASRSGRARPRRPNAAWSTKGRSACSLSACSRWRRLIRLGFRSPAPAGRSSVPVSSARRSDRRARSAQSAGSRRLHAFATFIVYAAIASSFEAR